MSTDATTTEIMTVVSGCICALVTAITSWTKYARYEFLAENHNLAARKFAAIGRDVALFFTKISTLPVEPEDMAATAELISSNDVALMAVEVFQHTHCPRI